jgi:hypothetical protein
MIHLTQARLLELLLASIIQSQIIVTTIIISRARGIKNHFIHKPAVRWQKGGNQ